MYKSLTQKNVSRLIGLMVIMILLLSSVAMFNKPVSASSGVNSSCGPWFDGLCCETWWPRCRPTSFDNAQTQALGQR